MPYGTSYQLRHTAATKVRREIQRSQFKPALQAGQALSAVVYGGLIQRHIIKNTNTFK